MFFKAILFIIDGIGRANFIEVDDTHWLGTRTCSELVARGGTYAIVSDGMVEFEPQLAHPQNQIMAPYLRDVYVGSADEKHASRMSLLLWKGNSILPTDLISPPMLFTLKIFLTQRDLFNSNSSLRRLFAVTVK